MGRMYVVTHSLTATAALSLLRVSAPSDAILICHEVKVSNEDIETSDQLAVQIHRASTDGTGTSATVTPLEVGDAAFGGSAVYDCSADPTAGVVLDRSGQNILNGWHFLWTPELRPIVSPSGRIVVHLDDDPASDTVMNVTMKFEEKGG